MRSKFKQWVCSKPDPFGDRNGREMPLRKFTVAVSVFSEEGETSANLCEYSVSSVVKKKRANHGVTQRIHGDTQREKMNDKISTQY